MNHSREAPSAHKQWDPVETHMLPRDVYINIDGIEIVKCEVLGQSFMLHQIWKMIGLAFFDNEFGYGAVLVFLFDGLSLHNRRRITGSQVNSSLILLFFSLRSLV